MRARLVIPLVLLIPFVGGSDAKAEDELTPRFGLVAIGESGPVCAIGGFIANEPQKTVECFDATTGRWFRAAAMPTARGLLGAAEVDGMAYLIGGTRRGLDRLAVVERYDPAAGAWTRLADLPTPRNALSAVAKGSAIYVIGGWGGDEDGRIRDFDTVEIYETQTDRWRSGEGLPTARSHMAAARLGDKIYTFGGGIQQAGSFVAMAEVEVYDPQIDEWSSAAPLPTPRWLPTAVPIGGRIYVMGGWTHSENGERRTTSVVEVYDPDTDSWWRDFPLPTPRAGHASVFVNGRVLLVGGTSDRKTEGLPSHVDWYVPASFDEIEKVGSHEATPKSTSVSQAEFRDGGAWGQIVEVELPFGNLRTNLLLDDLLRLGLKIGSTFTIRIDDREFGVTFGKDFSDVARGEWVAFATKNGSISVARNFASAAEACGCQAGDELLVTLRP